jgi:HNH endonuclease
MSTSPTGGNGSKSPRRAIPKRVRYEVLRRDNFTCRYCRSTENELTLDHLKPAVLGGTDDPSNLVACCKDCNAGKSSTSPDAAVIEQVSEDALRWAAAMQVAAGLMADELRDEWDYAEALDAEWSKWTCGYHKDPIPRPQDWRRSANSWRIAGLPIELTIDAARRALETDKVPPHGTWKYFCGIAWARVRKLQEAAHVSMTGSEEDTAVESDDYERGYADGLDRARRRASHYQYDALMRVTDAEAIAWAGLG